MMYTPDVFVIYVVNFYFLSNVKGSNFTQSKSAEDYYQVNYDYEEFNGNNSLAAEISSDSLIIPIPEEDSTQKNQEVTPKEEDDPDADLKDHDFIDNLMYIYYGSGNTNTRRLYASEIIIAGSVFSCVAQISTILLVLMKKDISSKKDLKELFLHMMLSYCMTNVAFVFGIFKTKRYIECLLVALLLTYFHLMTASWIFLYCFYVYKSFCEEKRFVRKFYYLYGYGFPLIFSLITFTSAPRSYETRKFCFMSVQRGMILNYMVPVFCLMILTAIYCIKGIRIFNADLQELQMNSNMDALTLYNNQMEVLLGKKCGNIDAVNLRGSKSCLSRLCAMQTTYDIVWFFLVLAIENMRESSSMAVVYAFTTCCLNWYIFAELKVFFPTSNKPDLKEVILETPKSCNGVESPDSNSCPSEEKPGSSDSVPLLIESTELKVMHYNPNISTIST